MKAFSIVEGRLRPGIPVADDDTIVVGDKGRGREQVRVPLPDGACVQDGRLVSVPSQSPGDLILIGDQSGYRGYWELCAPVIGPCSAGWPGEPVGASGPGCPECGGRWKHRWPAERIEPESIGVLIAEGWCAQGIAGRMGGGAVYLLAVRAGERFSIRRSGRLYGDPSVLLVSVAEDAVEMVPAREVFVPKAAEAKWAQI